MLVATMVASDTSFTTRPHPEPKRCALGEVDALWSQLRGTTNQEKAEATMDGSRYARSSAQRIRLETAVV